MCKLKLAQADWLHSDWWMIDAWQEYGSLWQNDWTPQMYEHSLNLSKTLLGRGHLKSTKCNQTLVYFAGLSSLKHILHHERCNFQAFGFWLFLLQMKYLKHFFMEHITAPTRYWFKSFKTKNFNHHYWNYFLSDDLIGKSDKVQLTLSKICNNLIFLFKPKSDY